MVIDEWTVRLWADAKISDVSAARLVAVVAAELESTATRLTTTVGTGSSGGAPTRVDVTRLGR